MQIVIVVIYTYIYILYIYINDTNIYCIIARTVRIFLPFKLYAKQIGEKKKKQKQYNDEQ